MQRDVLNPTDVGSRIFMPFRAFDLNYDGRVDIRDAVLVCVAFGSYPDSQKWNLNADLDRNNRVDMHDIGIVFMQIVRIRQSMIK